MSNLSYCTLGRAKTEAKIKNAIGDFETVFNALYSDVTNRFDSMTRNTFAPRIETRYFDASAPGLKHDILHLNYPCLSIDNITLNGTTVLDASDYELEVYTGAPAFSVYSQYGWSFTSTYRRAIAITGTWGYRTYYTTDGWKDLTTLNGAIASTTVTSVTVTDAALIDAGDMLQVDSEWLLVTDKSGNVLTVTRGYRGSTAATHDNSTTVSQWQTEPDVSHAAALAISYAYARLGNFQQVEFIDGAAITFPSDLPATVTNILRHYRVGYSQVV